jgi:hypothetical protein
MLFMLTLALSSRLSGQSLPEVRRTDWHKAGFPDQVPVYNVSVNINDFGGVGDGTTPNDTALSNAIAALNGQPGMVWFPEGTYLFHTSILLRDSLVLKGEGAESTQLHFDLGAAQKDCILAVGSLENSTTARFLSAGITKGDTLLQVQAGESFKPGELLNLQFDDSLVIFSSWARGLAGQLFEVVETMPNGFIRSNHPMRLDIPLAWRPRLTRVRPLTGAGIECLKIKRFDGNVPIGMNISFQFARQCWVMGVESEDCNFAHLSLAGSVHCEVYGNYFHHAFAYGGGGQGYGVACEATSSDNRIQNNCFEHLRHSVLLQSGANGNVIGYNYSTDPYWENFPIDGCGELVIHGNYPSFNLFEGNIVNNIRPDGSHGLNGPNNTFFRNRAQGYGFITTGTQSFLNVLGNEITSGALLHGLFLVDGTDNFLYNNNVQGTINPAGTTGTIDSSYYLRALPRFLEGQSFLIGAPAAFNTGRLPAELRFLNGSNRTTCEGRDELTVALAEPHMPIATKAAVSPNPFHDFLELGPLSENDKVEIWNLQGQLVFSHHPNGALLRLDTQHWPPGGYLVKISLPDQGGGINSRLVLKH